MALDRADRAMRRRLAGAVCGLLALWPAAASAQQPGGPVDPTGAPPTGVIVRYRSGVDAAERAAARADADVRREETLPVARMEVVEPEPGVTVRESVAALERSHDVAYAEPDVRRSAFVAPDDPLLRFEWALQNTGQSVGGTTGTPGDDINAEQAWDTTTGSRDVVVGVVDTGIDVAHPDLAPNVWANPGETGGGRETNGIDDDGDGLVDDTVGWDWVAGDNRPLDENGHGTHVSGTIAAHGNDAAGVAGVSWQASLMALRVLDATGSGLVSDAISAYAFAAAHGARVVNASLGGAVPSRAEQDAIAAAPNVLFVVAAGNDGADNDATPAFPCDYPLPNVVCVAATDQDDALADFSNFGATSVDLAAPGVNIASTWPGGRFALLDGTSMAAPHVVGAAVLALAVNPALDVAGLRAALLSSTEPRPGLTGQVATGGRLDAAAAVAAAIAAAAPPAPAPTPAPAPAPAPPAAAPPIVAGPPPVATPAPVPGAATPPVVAAAPDRIAPSLIVTVPRRVSLRTALSRGVPVTARCSEGCTVRLRLVVDARTRRRLHLRSALLARAQLRRASAGALTRRVRPSASARARLARATSLRVTVRAEAVDVAGNRRSRTAATTLRARR